MITVQFMNYFPAKLPWVKYVFIMQHKLIRNMLSYAEMKIQIFLQYCSKLTQQAIDQAKQSNTALPKNFSINRIVAECIDDLKMNKEIIAVMAHLQRSGEDN